MFELVNIAVVGAGTGGYTFAAHLTLLGHTVKMYELPKFAHELDAVKNQGGIEILPKDPVWGPPDEVMGPEITGFAKIDVATTNIEEALNDVDVIINAVPAMGHEPFARVLAPHLKDGQTLFVFGKGGGSIIYSRFFKELGVNPDIVIGESFLPYAATRMGRVLGKKYESKVRVEGVNKIMTMGAFPGKNAQKACDVINEIYCGTRKFSPGRTILESIFFDYNSISHPPIVLANAARIEAGDPKFRMYAKDICTPAVCNLIDAIDEEVAMLAKGAGIKGWIPLHKRPSNYEPFAQRTYDRQHTWFLEVCEGPYSLKSRYLMEDVKYGLRLFSSLGRMFNVPTPVSDAFVTLSSKLIGEDFWKTGRTVEKLGIDPSWNLKKLYKFLEDGEV